MITLYISSVSGNIQIKKHQQYIQQILEGKKIQFTQIDIAADEKARDHMRKVSGQSKIPQIFINDRYKGGYEEFEEAVESETLPQFLEL